MNKQDQAETQSSSKTNITFRFITAGFIALILIVTIATMRSYYVLRSFGNATAGNHLAELVSEKTQFFFKTVYPNQTDLSRLQYNALGLLVKDLKQVKHAYIYSLDKKQIWRSQGSSTLSLNQRERDAFNDLMANRDIVGKVIDVDFMTFEAWLYAPQGKMNLLPALVKLNNANNQTVAVLKLEKNFSEAINGALFFSFSIFILSTLAAVMMFLILYWVFRRGVKTIETQEKILNKHISRLSSLLSANKSLQRSMKTASARAVELNEQFLRRVGADLHDGPAQMIGYSVLRLDAISKNGKAQELSNEFPSIIDALEESMDEIRGISSGLVLPELEPMGLEECLRKVVTSNGVKSDIVVDQYYQSIEMEVPMPIKICAYRFVQEGLNNAYRHGRAEKCRLSVYIKNDVLVISLKDNGIGFRISKLDQGDGHLGLKGLKDRIESLGGQFHINSELGVGTALKLSVSVLDVN